MRTNLFACLLAGILVLPLTTVGYADPETEADSSVPAASEATTAPAAKPTPEVNLELNKLEDNGSGCRAFVVIKNDNPDAYETFKLDLVIFQTDGVIGKRFALDLAPLRGGRKSVKIFEIADTSCDKIGSFLINEALECKTSGGPVDSCLDRLTTSTRSDVEISK